MVTHKLKDDLFREKIATVRIAHQGSNSLIQTVNAIDYLPANLTLYAEVDFFNILSNYSYTLSVDLIKHTFETIPSYVTRVNIPTHQLSYKVGQLGKTQGSFDFNIVIEDEGDYAFIFSLKNEKGQVLDIYHQFISISKE